MTDIETYVIVKEFVRKGLAIDHTREMVIELHDKMDRVEDMLAHLLLDGYEKRLD